MGTSNWSWVIDRHPHLKRASPTGPALGPPLIGAARIGCRNLTGHVSLDRRLDALGARCGGSQGCQRSPKY
jgi:hypothetical protein